MAAEQENTKFRRSRKVGIVTLQKNNANIYGIIVAEFNILDKSKQKGRRLSLRFGRETTRTEKLAPTGQPGTPDLSFHKEEMHSPVTWSICR